MKKNTVFLLLILGACGILFLSLPDRVADVPVLIPRKILFGAPHKSSPQISPDGSLIAYLAPYQEVVNIFIYDRITKTDRVLTQEKNRGIQFFTWAPDGQSMLFLQDQGGNENWHLYKINIAGGEAKDLTPFQDVQAGVLTIDKHFPDHILIEMNKENKSLHDVYRLELSTGNLELVAKNTGQIAGWIVDAEMKVRGAAVSRPEGGSDILIRQDEQSDWKKIFSWNFEESVNSNVIGFSKNGKELYLSDSRDSDTARLVKINLLTGTSETLFSDPDYDVSAALNPEDREIEMVLVNRARNEIIPFRDSFKSDLDFLKSIEAGDLFLGNRSYDERYWIFGFNKDVSPLKFYIYDKKEKKVEFLFFHRPALAKYNLSSMKPFEILSRDGLKLRGYVTLPKIGIPPFPMVLFVHGGPWMRDSWGLSPVCQWLADRGYACLQVNFRGSAGFGKKFVNAGNKEWGRKMQTDLVDAVDWAVRNKIADPKRIGILGASYGGYAALAAATFTPDVFQCAIDMFGPSDLATLIRSMPPYWSLEKNNVYRRVGNPDTEASLLKERSPLFYTDRIKIPLLVAQGENDPRTPKSESDRIVKALRARGIPCEYLLFQDEGHGFAKPENRLKLFRAAEAFLAENLGGQFEK